jgi:hypothetical protein
VVIAQIRRGEEYAAKLETIGVVLHWVKVLGNRCDKFLHMTTSYI